MSLKLHGNALALGVLIAPFGAIMQSSCGGNLLKKEEMFLLVIVQK